MSFSVPPVACFRTAIQKREYCPSLPPTACFSIAHIRRRASPVRRLCARDAIPVVERKERILARRIPARGVLRLSSSNLSLNAIAAALRESKTSVSDVLRDAAHAELAKVGVTLRLLHVEYREECAARGEAAMSYGRFCKRCRQFTVSGKVVSRVGRKAGRNVKVDWSGPTMPLVDQAGIRVTVLRVIS